MLAEPASRPWRRFLRFSIFNRLIEIRFEEASGGVKPSSGQTRGKAFLGILRAGFKLRDWETELDESDRES